MPKTYKDEVEAYTDTLKRIEQDIHMIDNGAFNASAAISLKRIADYLQFISTIIIPAVISFKFTYWFLTTIYFWWMK